MNPSIEAWIKKAENDLKAAEVLMEGDILDAAIYHTQQCAEKSLKAFIIYKTKSFSKTHNLTKLVKICNNIDKEFKQFKNQAEKLTPYAVEFRYPGDELTPAKKEVEEAIKMAGKIFKFVRSKLK
ncbi:HEPN domain-containing protein [Natroniella acetigena]|uniref:HEPN domain-containing protein n=1 Tax=Natroniella acetigena TaxID=52004 RepID=UPI00200A2874|nr:HEPN domain-containing protein [Natroniella acetigena]MCK8826572.1 HEPN domain-containing protein [Natroniella acetigena]